VGCGERKEYLEDLGVAAQDLSQEFLTHDLLGLADGGANERNSGNLTSVLPDKGDPAQARIPVGRRRDKAPLPENRFPRCDESGDRAASLPGRKEYELRTSQAWAEDDRKLARMKQSIFPV
jgi:hypothetical protein